MVIPHALLDRLSQPAHDKSVRLGSPQGLRVFVCSNMAFSGDFTRVLAKHSKSFNLIDTLSVGVEEADDMPALSESE